jgi:uncharacterized protein YcbK (DUF882 family)
VKVIRAGDRLTPHFKKSELACRCRRRDCQAVPMNRAFMQRLEAIRMDWGRPLVVTSGVRCEIWNKKVGGADQSQHVLGLAVDLYFLETNEAVAFAALAEKHGFGGIEAGIHLVHLDGRSGHARWTYDHK